MIKVVLESQLDYWLALAHIPSIVLNNIRKLTFSYLWSGTKKYASIHLCNWELLARPKQFGGWGIRNIFCFSRALGTKSLWRGLMQPAIWKRVLKYKYFSHTPVIPWLRSVIPVVQYGSQYWKNLINALPLLVHWLAWKPRSGVDIIIGKNAILGLDMGSFISQELIMFLNDHQVVFIF